MLSYWILRDRNRTPIGLVRQENEHVFLQLNAPRDADWMLFSDTDAVPVVPGGEAALAGANAVLGLRDGEIVGFAAAKDAQSAACYRVRMSRLYTMPKEPEPQPPAEATLAPSEADVPETPEEQAVSEPVDSVDESAERTATFSLLLSRADTFFAQFDAPLAASAAPLVHKEDTHAPTGGIDLFPQAFPGARWRYVDGSDILPHYEGLWIGKNGERTRILAVKGRAAPRPPRALFGFTRYARGSDGNGYWIRTE